MTSTARKAKQLAEREQLFLDTATHILLERGYPGLTMDRVAEATDYSKGTLYHHFKSKQDMLAGILIQTGQLRRDLFERAAAFPGLPRERMAGIGAAVELFQALHPQHGTAETIIKSSSIREKASLDRRHLLFQQEQAVIGTCFGITRDAVARGDLPLHADQCVEDITFGLWSLYHGAFAIVGFGMPLPELGFVEPMQMLRRHANQCLDGYGWQPLSTNKDYEDVRQRILHEQFPAEARRAGLIT